MNVLETILNMKTEAIKENLMPTYVFMNELNIRRLVDLIDDNYYLENTKHWRDLIGGAIYGVTICYDERLERIKMLAQGENGSFWKEYSDL